MNQQDDVPRLLVSHLTLRRTVGILGVLLPLLLAIGCFVVGPSCTELLESISHYYDTEVGDVFVGILFAIAWFLFAYRVCSVIMLACIASIALYVTLFEDTAIARVKPVFWLESLALWAFGASWFVKGETLWADAAPSGGR